MRGEASAAPSFMLCAILIMVCESSSKIISNASGVARFLPFASLPFTFAPLSIEGAWVLLIAVSISTSFMKSPDLLSSPSTRRETSSSGKNSSIDTVFTFDGRYCIPATLSTAEFLFDLVLFGLAYGKQIQKELHIKALSYVGKREFLASRLIVDHADVYVAVLPIKVYSVNKAADSNGGAVVKRELKRLYLAIVREADGQLKICGIEATVTEFL